MSLPNNSPTAAPDIATLHEDVVNLSALVRQMKDELDQFHEIFNNIKVFLKIIVAIERTAVVIAKITAAGVILWAIFKYSVHNAAADIKELFK